MITLYELFHYYEVDGCVDQSAKFFLKKNMHYNDQLTYFSVVYENNDHIIKLLCLWCHCRMIE